MILHTTAKLSVLAAGLLLFEGAGLVWGQPAPQAKNDEKPKTKDDAPKAKEEGPKDPQQRLKGTWKVVYSEGELPVLKLPKGGALQKPMFYLIDKDNLTWDNGNPGDPARLARFHVRYPEYEADIQTLKAPL